MKDIIERIKTGKLSPVYNFVDERPRLSAWGVLSLAMMVFLIIEAADVGFTALQWIFLTGATFLVAWICIWIINWSDDDSD